MADQFNSFTEDLIAEKCKLSRQVRYLEEQLEKAHAHSNDLFSELHTVTRKCDDAEKRFYRTRKLRNIFFSLFIVFFFLFSFVLAAVIARDVSGSPIVLILN